MRDKRSQDGQLKASGSSLLSSTTSGSDAMSERLTRISKQVGNEEILKQIHTADASRDEMLAYLCHRLKAIRTVQMREVDKCNEKQDWWKDVADTHKEDIKKPEPKRWAESAYLYERAAYYLCNGNMTVARELMKRAVNAEYETFRRTTKLVRTEDLDVDMAPPAIGGGAATGRDALCSPCAMPNAVDLAHLIQNCNVEAPTPHVKRRVRDPWWTEEEEEEEEEHEGSG